MGGGVPLIELAVTVPQGVTFTVYSPFSIELPLFLKKIIQGS